jgi:predicted nucleic acid-binding protein
MIDIVDTNILVAALRKQERDHEKALEILSGIESLWITDFIIIELANVLCIRESRKIAKEAIQGLLLSEAVHMTRMEASELQETLKQYTIPNNTLSIVDLSLTILQTTRKARIHTFDKKLQKALT